MIDLSGRLIRDRINYIIPNSWVDKDSLRMDVSELSIIHSLCVINLDSGAETISCIIGVLSNGLFHYHTSKLAYGINVCHTIVSPITMIEGDRLRVKLYASAADTPVVVAYQGMIYPIVKRENK